MISRRHGRKPTIALWMLVAVADVAILTTAVGALVMLSIVATLAVLVGGVVAARLLSRRAEPTPQVVSRRRA
jgi:hypothetical protein